MEEKSIEDPMVMYLIVKESLNMSIGKTAAQTAHASEALCQLYFDYSKAILEMISLYDSGIDFISKYNYIQRYDLWVKENRRKVVLKADDKEWKKLKEEFKNSMVLIVDAGLTEIVSGSETCIGIFPIKKSEAPKCIKRLQTLK